MESSPAALPEVQTSSALDAVAKALPGWVKSLLDLTGRNQLLFCKPAGKIDLASAEVNAIRRLVSGDPVRLSELFPTTADLTANAKVARNISKRVRTYDEELGVRVGRLVSGFVSWPESDSSRHRNPNAPLFLRYLSLTQPQPGVDDFVLKAEPDVEVNEVLLHLLQRDFGLRLSDEKLEEIADLAAENFSPARPGIVAFKAAAREVQGLQVNESLLAGTFQYQKLPMVQDLQRNIDLFAQSDLIAAVAGNTEAMTRIRHEAGSVSRDDPNFIPPADEFLVLDADPSQNYAVNAALAGRNIVIQGPPGTGKSQTISNLIAACVARGKTVLFVAEKRAAIDAVLNRLDAVGLGGVVLDLHDGATNKARVAAEIRDSISTSGQVTRPEVAEVHRKVERSRARLLAHAKALHEIRDPWGISVFEAQALGLGTPDDFRVELRLPAATIRALDKPQAQQAREELEDAASLGAFAPIRSRSPWATATDLAEADTSQAYDCASNASRVTLPAATEQYNAVIAATRLREPDTLNDWTSTIDLYHRVTDIQQKWTADVWTADLRILQQGCASRGKRHKNGWDIPWGERRAAKKTAKSLLLTSAHGKALYDGLVEVQTTLDAWTERSSDDAGLPQPPDLQSLETAHNTLRAELATLSGYLQRTDLETVPVTELTALLSRLAHDPTDVMRTQRVNALMRALHARSLDGLVDTIRSKGVGWTTEEAKVASTGVFNYVWALGVIEQVALADPTIGAFDGTEHNLIADEYAMADRQHIMSTPHRILRAHAERLAAARNQNPLQEQVLDVELKKKRRIKPVRELLALAPSVIPSAKPCWAMSPLVVSQALPATTKFDLVIFDEASQVRPADAIPALGRAQQAVICGDSKQLPPSSFFDESGDYDDEPEQNDDDEPATGNAENLGSLTQDTESILDVFDAALGSNLASQYRLLWHYRSRDARLIAFSDAWFYDKSLLTFPGTAVESPLTYVPVPHPSRQPQNVANEVKTVVDLAVEHARTRPHESLGIIAMSKKHADRVDAALEQRLREEDDPDLRSFFRESAEEPFFVKNLERVQGDERDAIIITMGYIKSPDGRMQYRFGPINNKGGERRLNVAFTRAKDRLTFVSSFTHEDLDPARLTSAGGQALRAYIQYVTSGGTDLGDRGPSLRPLNPFEIHLRDRLQNAGIAVIPQYGVAGYWIDFAATHPDHPGQMVLAIEADGASYHSGETARARDRLRQEHLERLGWTFHRIWSTDYFRDPDAEVARTLKAYHDAVTAADHPEANPDEYDLWAEAETPTGALTAKPVLRSGRQPVAAYQPIGNYTDQQLLAVVNWVQSDDLVRTNDEILEDVMQALGFQRRGSRIVDRITQAVAAYSAKGVRP